VNLLILVVDDEPDVEVLFRQQFRHDLRAGRFTIEFAQTAPAALRRITDAAGVRACSEAKLDSRPPNVAQNQSNKFEAAVYAIEISNIFG
jgi:CheY-like chemotaxis protein